jgi:hypothetical protein
VNDDIFWGKKGDKCLIFFSLLSLSLFLSHTHTHTWFIYMKIFVVCSQKSLDFADLESLSGSMILLVLKVIHPSRWLFGWEVWESYNVGFRHRSFVVIRFYALGGCLLCWPASFNNSLVSNYLTLYTNWAFAQDEIADLILRNTWFCLSCIVV